MTRRLVGLWCGVLVACAPPSTPTGAFAAPTALQLGALLDPPFAQGEAYVRDLAVGDFNGDGLSDLVVAWPGFSTISRFADSGLTVPTRIEELQAPLWAEDLDGDLRAELIGAKQNNSLRVLRWEDTQGFVQRASLSVARMPMALAMGDVVGDDKRDLVALTVNLFEAHSLEAFARTEAGIGFANAVVTSVPSKSERIAIGDVDGDGKGDVASAAFRENRVELFRGGTAGLSAPIFIATNPTPDAVAIGVLQGDVAADLIATSRTGKATLHAWADGGVGPATELGLSACTQVLIVDVDADGVSDVVGLCNGVVEVLRRTDTGFTSLNRFPVDGALLLRRGDVTGDGLADLLVTPSSGTGTVYVLRALAK